KMPAPITMPTVIMVASKTLSVGMGTPAAPQLDATSDAARSRSKVVLTGKCSSARADVGGSLVVASDLRLDPVALHLSLEPGMYVAFGEHHGDLRAAQFTLGDLLLV